MGQIIGKNSYLETCNMIACENYGNKLVGWPQLVGLLLRLGASWYSDGAGLAVVGAYLVLQEKTM